MHISCMPGRMRETWQCRPTRDSLFLVAALTHHPTDVESGLSRVVGLDGGNDWRHDMKFELVSTGRGTARVYVLRECPPRI